MTLSAISFFGRRAYRLANDHVSITVVPGLSGRVMELIVGGQNLIWINEPLLKGEVGGDPAFGGWKNWGGYKTWLAPQSRWPNPDAQPDDMDNVEWDVIAQTDNSIALRGPVLPWGGVRLGRRFALKTLGVSPQETIRNESSAPQTWAVWAVAQFPVPGCAAFPRAGARRILFSSPPAFEKDRLRFVGDAKWKVGVLAEEGWGEYRADNWSQTFRASFAAHASLPHPDDCNLEAWSNTDPAYMELEWLGPIVTLRPGEEWVFEAEWVISPPSTSAPPYPSPRTDTCTPRSPA